MKKVFMQVIVIFVLGLMALLFPKDVYAIDNCNSPSYGNPACYCPSDYPVFTFTVTASRYCCPPDHTLEVRLDGDWCVFGGREEKPVLAKALFGGVRGLCLEDDMYLVEPGGNNYCIKKEQQVGAGDGSYKGQYFLGCKPSALAKTTERVGGGTIPLADYCTGDEGVFITQEQRDTRICVCGDGITKKIEEELTGSCQDVCGTLGVMFDNTNEPVGACKGDQDCLNCTFVGGDPNGASTGYTFTALGCIDTSRSGVITWLIRLALILVTAAVVFRFVQASFLIRSAEPEKIKEGQEIITSAVIALILVLIAVPLLEFIGVKVLGIFPKGFITTGN